MQFFFYFFFIFFVVPRDGQVPLGLPDIETLDVLTIKCNTVDMKKNKMSTSIVRWGMGVNAQTTHRK